MHAAVEGARVMPAKPQLPFALIVAHPGHELRVFHWMERARPLYGCLTDGSGGAARSRLASSAALLATAGATPCAIFGRHSDRDLYAALLGGRIAVFVALAREVASVLEARGIHGVAGDAAEGFNPIHDICRFVIDAAIRAASRRTGRAIDNLEFDLDASPRAPDRDPVDGEIRIALDPRAIERKHRAALGYRELRAEVANALDRFGALAYAIESLRPAATKAALARFDAAAPDYERFGAERVRQGLYREIIRYREHVLPVRQALEAAIL